MPSGFWYPNQNSEYWIPFAPTRFQLEASAPFFAVIARLKPGLTVAQAQEDIAAIAVAVEP
jgi:hypothetical protein